MFHPLCGATLDTLLPLLAKGGVRPARAHVAAIALAMATLRLPFTAGEAAALAVLRRLRPDADLPAPIFIVGHWRSGTTHLSNLLSRSRAFGILSPMSVALPAEARGLTPIVRPFIEQFFPPTRLIDDMPLRPDLPQEDELALANLSTVSCHHGLYFPSRLVAEFDRGVFFDGVSTRERTRWTRRLVAFVGKMTRAAGGRPVLIRNPADSARIPLLSALWPQARFIHIHRHPVDVCASSIHMFATLIRELSLGDTTAAESLAQELVRHVYPRLMRTLHKDTAALAPDRLVEIRYDDLRGDPVTELARVDQVFALPALARALPSIAASVATGVPHRPSRGDANAAELRWLRDHPDIFRNWGYGSEIGANRPAAMRPMQTSSVK